MSLVFLKVKCAYDHLGSPSHLVALGKGLRLSPLAPMLPIQVDTWCSNESDFCKGQASEKWLQMALAWSKCEELD